MYSIELGSSRMRHAKCDALETRAADWFAFTNGAVIGALGAAFAFGAVQTLGDIVGLIRDLHDREAHVMSEVERLRAELTEAEETLRKIVEAREAAEQARDEVEAEQLAAA